MMTIESKDLAGRYGPDLWAYTLLLTDAYEHLECLLSEAYRYPGTNRRLTALCAWSEHLVTKQSQVVLALPNAQQPTIIPIVGVSNVTQLIDTVEATRFSLL